jgi:hypothetical protein
VSVNLAQVDAVVTDSHGNHVAGLARDDFKVYLDDKPQRITAFPLISAAPVASAASGTPASGKSCSSNTPMALTPGGRATRLRDFRSA